jgi:hypothetical protein
MKVVADETWYLTVERDARVRDGDPRIAWMLVAKGCEIEDSVLESYPVLDEMNSKAIHGPPENKAINGPEETKRPRGRPKKSSIPEAE